VTSALDHLRELVACDTRNPPRALSKRDRLFAYIGDQLAGFDVELEDHGDGCVSFLATRGRPRRLVNIHLDTVPDNEQWTRDPLALVVEGERAYGLGACDIKGGAAALLEAAQGSEGDIAILFSTDEEVGQSTCVHTFLASGRELLNELELVVVSEPTQCRAVLAHRGFARGEAIVRGVPGHSSEPRALDDNANHRLADWLHEAIAAARERDEDGALGLTGLRFNCGIIEGGSADNVIADRARGEFSVRPGPGLDPAAVARELGSLAAAEGAALFVGPPLPAADAERREHAASDLAARLGVDVAPPVDFWTEAALFSAAGFVTFVCGPGDIAQAHVADEWVALEQLERARDFYLRVIEERS
jgi:acetylornithine deacetylase